MMRYDTIADIYSANEVSRGRLLSALERVEPSEAHLRPEDEKWSIAEIAEHLAMVEAGALRICGKLISEAKAVGKHGDGKVTLSDGFRQGTAAAADTKIEAPDRVAPTGDQSIADSISKLVELRQALAGLQTEMEKYDLSGHHFPHPVFGNMTAIEWLLLLGWHESRHTDQIERILQTAGLSN